MEYLAIEMMRKLLILSSAQGGEQCGRAVEKSVFIHEIRDCVLHWILVVWRFVVTWKASLSARTEVFGPHDNVV